MAIILGVMGRAQFRKREAASVGGLGPLPSWALAHSPCSSGDNLTRSPTECGDIYWCGWAPRKAPLILFLSSIGCVLCLWVPHGQNDPSLPMCQYLTDQFRSHTAMHGE